jgi:hypothetical protein
MAFGGSIFLLALGAILAFAVGNNQIGNVNVDLIGYILMAAGVLGIVLGLTIWAPRNRDRETIVARRDPML